MLASSKSCIVMFSRLSLYPGHIIGGYFTNRCVLLFRYLITLFFWAFSILRCLCYFRKFFFFSDIVNTIIVLFLLFVIDMLNKMDLTAVSYSLLSSSGFFIRLHWFLITFSILILRIKRSVHIAKIFLSPRKLVIADIINQKYVLSLVVN